MTHPTPTYTTLDEWIAREAIPFSVEQPASFNAAVDKMIASLDNSVELLGLGEALHGGEDILMLRNRLFQRLVEAHGYCAIAIESSFPRSPVANEYIHGRGPASYEEIKNTGLTQGFGSLEANRELLDWMRSYNADPAHRTKLHFYGFDMPVLAASTAGPRQVLHAVLDYLISIDGDSGQERRQRIDSLIGADFDWDNPAIISDPSLSIGLSPAATTLRIETEDLLTELRIRRSELVAKSDKESYLEALHYAEVARQLLNYHAAVARKSDTSELLSIRAAIMADNLTYIVDRERERGKVLAFAHNSHMQRGKAVWPWFSFWPVGSQLNDIFGSRYAVIGSAVGVSEANSIGLPEAGSLEARLTALSGSGVFIPTHKGQQLPASEISTIPVRSGSAKNMSYMPLAAQSFTDFDWLVVLDSTTYARGWQAP